MARGYAAEAYGRPVAALCDRLVEIASKGLAEDERAFLAPLAELVAQRETLADIAESRTAR